MSYSSFKAKRAVITGASGGIGSCLVRMLAARGVSTGLLARGRERLERLQSEIEAGGGTALAVPADVRDRESMDEALGRIRAEWGGVDMAIACAGTYVRGLAQESDPAVHEDQWRVSYLGAFHLFQNVAPEMVERGWGRLCLIASVDGLKGMPRESAYAAGKAAASSYAAVLRQELRGSGVRVTAVHPSRTDTPMTTNLEVPWVSHKIRPERVAHAALRGMRRGQATVIVPALGPRLLWWLEVYTPALADRVTRLLRLSGRVEGEDV